MKALSLFAGRGPWLAACALGVLGVGGLPPLASAAPAAAMQADAAAGTEAGALPLQIAAAAEHLFDVALASEWPAVQAALQSLQQQSAGLDRTFEAQFAAAGGRSQDLAAARESLRVDLGAAFVALDAEDFRTLVAVANRIALTSGELAKPFAAAQDAPVALKVDAVMFEARRMRHALAWGDTHGYESAQQDFNRRWVDLSGVPGLDPARLDALERAVTAAALIRDDATEARLQHAAQDVAGALR
jgi:hypothetical protein